MDEDIVTPVRRCIVSTRISIGLDFRSRGAVEKETSIGSLTFTVGEPAHRSSPFGCLETLNHAINACFGRGTRLLGGADPFRGPLHFWASKDSVCCGCRVSHCDALCSASATCSSVMAAARDSR